MIVVVTGGRDYHDERIIRGALNSVHTSEEGPITLLVEGEATGVDKICAEWAEDMGVPVVRMKADWTDVSVPGAVVRKRRDGTLYNVLAGFFRNQRMLDDYDVGRVLVFPGGNGTADMFDRVLRKGARYTVVAPSPRDQRIYNLTRNLRYDHDGFWYKAPKGRGK